MLEKNKIKYNCEKKRIKQSEQKLLKVGNKNTDRDSGLRFHLNGPKFSPRDD